MKLELVKGAKREVAEARRALAHNVADQHGDEEYAAMFKLADRLTRSDRSLLASALTYPIDVDVIAPAPSAYSVLWLQNYEIIKVWIDPNDRVWIRTTSLGAYLLHGKHERRTRVRHVAAHEPPEPGQ